MGDSITEGYINGVVDEERRYTTVFDILLIQAGYAVRVENSGLAGETSTEGAHRLAGILAYADFDVATILYGANDLLVENDGEPRVLPHTFGENLRFMVTTARAEGIIPVLLSLVPVIPERYYLSHDRDLYEKYGGITSHWETYDETVRGIAEEEDVVLVDLRRLFGDSLDIALGPDGGHPSFIGHRIIGSGVFGAIESLGFPREGNQDGGRALLQCYAFPNPFKPEESPRLTVHVSVATGGDLEGKVYDPSGRTIADFRSSRDT